MPETAASLTAAQRAYLTRIADALSTDAWSGDTLHAYLHELKAELGPSPREAFGAIYQAFLGKDSGPQAGWLMARWIASSSSSVCGRCRGMPPEGRPCIVAAYQRLEDQYLDAIREVDPRVRVVRVTDNDNWLQQVPNAEILLGLRPRRHEVARAPDLRWVHVTGAGVDKLVREVSDTHVIVTNSHVHAEPISEHVFALLLAHTRRMREIFEHQARKEWGKPAVRGEIISGKTMGILGLGHIGTAVAVRARAFGMRVVGVRRRARPIPGVERVVAMDGLDDVLRESDVLVDDAAADQGYREPARGQGQKIALLPKGAFVINIGRGALLDEGSLNRAVKEGRLSGAGLDVFAEEPLSKLSPRCGRPRI